MLTKPKLVILYFIQTVCGLFVYTPVVEVGEGKLRGFRGFDGQNRYYGIPYASSERFQAPKPPAKWNGVLQAISQYDTCSHGFPFLNIGTEDCLKLDIYTPEHAVRGQKLPVLIFFHGGAYYYGGKWQYNPLFLVNKNVIVVIINYRLGALGFLCINNVANLGLKDQLAALKWVQKNIAVFGGDPDNVTISGQSAGASSASMHFLSKLSKGLFHKAILMSGTTFVPWAFNVDPLTPAFEDASKIGPVKSTSDVYNTFLNAPLDDLLKATMGTSKDTRFFKYSPCGDFNFTEPFFHDTPYNIIKSGDFNKVPILSGFTDLEGLLFYSLYTQRDLQYFDSHFAERLPSQFVWCSDNDKRKIASKIHSHYFGNKKIFNNEVIKGAVNMFSDWISYASSDAFSKLIAKYSDKPVYNYMFSYEGGMNFIKFLFDRGIGLKGATHVDDLLYVFKPLGITLPSSRADVLITEKFTTMWTNFMKYGDPTPNETTLLPIRWPATTANRSQVMRIDLPLSVIDTPARVKGEFYLNLLCEYGLSGYVPCESAMRCNMNQ